MAEPTAALQEIARSESLQRMRRALAQVTSTKAARDELTPLVLAELRRRHVASAQTNLENALRELNASADEAVELGADPETVAFARSAYDETLPDAKAARTAVDDIAPSGRE